jgi:hypothetical protein
MNFCLYLCIDRQCNELPSDLMCPKNTTPSPIAGASLQCYCREGNCAAITVNCDAKGVWDFDPDKCRGIVWKNGI